MPVQNATGTANATTETTTPLALVKERYVSGTAVALTETLALPFGRDRYILGMTAESVAMGLATAVRERYVIGTASVATETDCSKLASMPAVPSPTGQLWLDGQPFKSRLIKKGQSLRVRFELLGKKLANLKTTFKLFDLQDNLLIEKQDSLAPGGLEIDTETPKQSGQVSYVGYIFIDRQETLFADYPKEFETKYEFEIGHSRINYPIEDGFLSFLE